MNSNAQITKGLWFGLLGIVIFSVTLPMTRLAVGTPEAPQMSGVFIALGLGALVLELPLLSWAVQVVGVAYLLWLAYKVSQSRQLSEADASRLNVTFWQGAALQFVNIKAWMLALAIVSGWIAGREAPGMRLAIVLPVMLAYAFVSNLAYALAGSLLREWLSGPDGSGLRLRWFNYVMAAVLVATAVWMLFI